MSRMPGLPIGSSRERDQPSSASLLWKLRFQMDPEGELAACRPSERLRPPVPGRIALNANGERTSELEWEAM
jgi:hypothetical protein